MKFTDYLWIAILAFACVLSGCATPPSAPDAETPTSEVARNNCYSLLYQLLNDEKGVNKLRFFKHEDADLKAIIQQVSSASEAGVKQLEQFSREDPSLALKDYGLPPGETKTRASIRVAQEEALLDHTGSKFEITLILDQAEALNYAAHLAKVAGENDFRPDRARYLAGLSEQMKGLHDQVVGLLSVKP